MRLPPQIRLVFGALVVTAGVALLWWLVGYQIGKAMLSGADLAAFKKGLGFDEGAFLRLVFLALVGAVTVVAASGTKSWMPLLGVILGAVLLNPERSAGATVGTILFVLCVGGLSEMGAGARALLVAALAGIAIAVAFTLEGPFGRSELAVVAALRGIFWFLPLLVLPDYAERFVLKKIGI